MLRKSDAAKLRVTSDKGKAAYDCKDRGGEVLVEGGAEVVRQSEHYHKADDCGHYMDYSECFHYQFDIIFSIIFRIFSSGYFFTFINSATRGPNPT